MEKTVIWKLQVLELSEVQPLSSKRLRVRILRLFGIFDRKAPSKNGLCVASIADKMACGGALLLFLPWPNRVEDTCAAV